MEELIELRSLVQRGDLESALSLIDELEEMSKDDKINKIYSYAIILLLNLIMQSAENRSTSSWEVSIRNSVISIQRTNKRRKAGGNYLSDREIIEILEDAYDRALDNARLEAFGGAYNAIALGKMVNQTEILAQASQLLQDSL
ncbi:MAG: DUF29 domain-containing protein [Pseudanabaena sp. CAN_BIN31]|nr:DUF29 domain-containing protein [Pseudanabaena sp. CAN_BIN31]